MGTIYIVSKKDELALSKAIESGDTDLGRSCGDYIYSV